MKELNLKQIGHQSGMTLMEVIASLAIMAVVVVGALALYNSAQSSQTSTSLVQDVSSIRASLKQSWAGQGTYGASGTNLNQVLKSANRIPSTMTASAATPPVITTTLNGTLVAAAAATAGQFSITLTNVPEDVCIALATGTNSWVSLGAGVAGATMIVAPVTPTSADTACVATNIMIFTGA